MDSTERKLTGPTDGLSGPRISDVQAVYQSEHSLGRLVRYQEYRRYYLGDHWDNAPLRGERRITLNYCRVFVNKAASYLLSKPVGYDVRLALDSRTGRAKSQEARAVESYLGEVGDFNDLAGLDLATAITSGTLGDGAFTVRWDAQAGMPRVTAVDPFGLECRWRGDDLRTLVWVRQNYWVAPVELTGEQRERLGDLRGGDEYTAVQAHEEWTAGRWRLVAAGVEVDGGPNPYGEIPYVVYPNLRVPGEFWGEGDLADLLGLQKELNERVSVFSQILEICGNPVAVVEGASEEDTSTLKVGVGQLWTIPAGSKAYILNMLEAGGAEAHLRYLDSIYRGLHDISEMPRTSFGDSSGQSQARSGVALEIELQPLLHKLSRKRAILSSAYLRRALLVLRIARLNGVQLAEEVSLRTIWPAILPQDRAALVQQEAQLVGAGIHPPTKAIELLEDPDPDAVFQEVLEEGRQLAGIRGARDGTAGSAEDAKGTNRAPARVAVSAHEGVIASS